MFSKPRIRDIFMPNFISCSSMITISSPSYLPWSISLFGKSLFSLEASSPPSHLLTTIFSTHGSSLAFIFFPRKIIGSHQPPSPLHWKLESQQQLPKNPSVCAKGREFPASCPACLEDPFFPECIEQKLMSTLACLRLRSLFCHHRVRYWSAQPLLRHRSQPPPS